MIKLFELIAKIRDDELQDAWKVVLVGLVCVVLSPLLAVLAILWLFGHSTISLFK